MPSHTERCHSANRYGSGEDFECICNDLPVPPRPRVTVRNETPHAVEFEGAWTGSISKEGTQTYDELTVVVREASHPTGDVQARHPTLLLEDLSQIAFTESLLAGPALERIRRLLDPDRAVRLRVSDDADIALVPLRDRIEHLCKKGWQQGDEVAAFVTEVREELSR